MMSWKISSMPLENEGFSWSGAGVIQSSELGLEMIFAIKKKDQ